MTRTAPKGVPSRAKASDATTTGSEKAARARSLVRGEDVRAAAAAALVRAAGDATAGDDDSDDTGTEALDDATGASTSLVSRRRRKRQGTGDEATEPGVAQATDGATTPGTPATDTHVEDTHVLNAPESVGASAPRTTKIQPHAAVTRTPKRAAATQVEPTRRLDARHERDAATALTNEGPAHENSQLTARAHHYGATDVMPRVSAPVHTQAAFPITVPARAETPASVTPAVLRQNPLVATRRLTRRTSVTIRTANTIVRTPSQRLASAAVTRGTASVTWPVAVPIAVVALALIATFLMMLTIACGAVADEDRDSQGRMLADVATRTYQEGADAGHYHFKGEAFRAYVGGVAPGRGWDAAFVSWCMGQAGQVDAGLVGRYASVASYVARFEHDVSAGEVHRPNDRTYIPRVGDLIVLWADTPDARIEIVCDVAADGLTVTTVAGDALGGEVGAYDRDADGWGGYVSCRERAAHAAGTTYISPAYSADAASTAAEQ